jgi:hypothetical protein
MKKGIALLLSILSLSFTAPALADGFSATLEGGSDGGLFSTRASLNYSMEIIPNTFIGASLQPAVLWNVPGTQFAVGARVAAKHVFLITKDFTTSVNAYIGTGINLFVVPAFAVGADINAGLDGYKVIGTGIKVYGGLDTALNYNFTSSAFGYNLSAYGGLFFEPVRNLEARVQGGVGFGGSFSGGSAFTWKAESSIYYTFMPQFKLGANIGYGSNGFSIGLGLLFAEKPGSLGIAGNYLP